MRITTYDIKLYFWAGMAGHPANWIRGRANIACLYRKRPLAHEKEVFV
jgi:hypothetical protein